MRDPYPPQEGGAPVGGRRQPPARPQQPSPPPYQPDPAAQQWYQQHPPGYPPSQGAQQGAQQGWGPPQHQSGPPPRPRKRHTGRNLALALLGVLGLLVVVAVAAGGNRPATTAPTGDQPVSQPAAKPAKPKPATRSASTAVRAGQPVTIRDALGRAMATVTVGRVAATAEPQCGGFCKPDRGVFLATKATISAQRDGVEVNPAYFVVVDQSGQRYEMSGQAFTGEFGAPLSVTRLAKGQKASGALVWDVEPAGKHGKVLMVNWLDQSKTIASWSY